MEPTTHQARLPVRCSYTECRQSFQTEEEMRRHKINSPEHHYCKKCDVDCRDWKELKDHKVEAMWPWVTGRTPDGESQPQHIVCEFCGEDFKSFGGRRRHREQNHRDEQDIRCPGCSHHFTRAAAYLKHIETGRCESITRKELQQNIQQKHVVKQLLEGGGLAAFKKRVAYQHSDLKAVTCGDGDSDSRTDPHSTSTPNRMLTDGNRADGARALPPHLRKRDNMAKRLAQSPHDDISGSMQHLSIGPNTRPMAGDWEALLQQCAVVEARVQATNLFTARWWDSSSPDYDAVLFYNPLSGMYCCRFPGCEDTAYNLPSDVEAHVRAAHLPSQHRCPQCLGIFKTAHALLSHMENTLTCTIAQSSKFGQLVSDMSGGFLKGRGVAPVEFAADGEGVLSTTFAATEPRGGRSR